MQASPHPITTAAVRAKAANIGGSLRMEAHIAWLLRLADQMAAPQRSLQALYDAGCRFEIRAYSLGISWTLLKRLPKWDYGHPSDTVAEAIAALWDAHEAEVARKEAPNAQ